jgi:hypothetical protein
LTPDHVVLAADRRLVDLSSGEVVDDESCKVALVGSQLVFAYTGLANVRPPPRGQTDLWLVDILSPPPDRLPEIFLAVRHRATDVFRQITHLGPRAKRHAFVAAGWSVKTDGAADFEPFFASVSNAQQPYGGWSPWADAEFTVHWKILSSGDFRLDVAGQPLDRKARRLLIERLREPPNRKPMTLARLLISAIRSTAQMNPTVGTGILVAILPQENVSASSGFTLSTGTGSAVDGPTCLYVPSGAEAGVVHAPHLISREMSIADVQIHDRALSDEEDRQSYEEGIRKLS